MLNRICIRWCDLSVSWICTVCRAVVAFLRACCWRRRCTAAVMGDASESRFTIVQDMEFDGLTHAGGSSNLLMGLNWATHVKICGLKGFRLWIPSSDGCKLDFLMGSRTRYNLHTRTGQQKVVGFTWTQRHNAGSAPAHLIIRNEPNEVSCSPSACESGSVKHHYYFLS